MPHTIDSLIRVVKGWRDDIRDTGETHIFVKNPQDVEELLDALKELKGLSSYQLKLGEELTGMAKRHRKMTKEKAIAIAAGDMVPPIMLST